LGFLQVLHFHILKPFFTSWDFEKKVETSASVSQWWINFQSSCPLSFSPILIGRSSDKPPTEKCIFLGFSPGEMTKTTGEMGDCNAVDGHEESGVEGEARLSMILSKRIALLNLISLLW
jgi:hypothetical protein